MIYWGSLACIKRVPFESSTVLLVLDDVLPARHRVPPAHGRGGSRVLCCGRSRVSRTPSGASAAAAEGRGRGRELDGSHEHDGNGTRRGCNGAAHVHIPGKVTSSADPFLAIRIRYARMTKGEIV